jgi:hypothetical protein
MYVSGEDSVREGVVEEEHDYYLLVQRWRFQRDLDMNNRLLRAEGRLHGRN